jgi:hypothetical protein
MVGRFQFMLLPSARTKNVAGLLVIQQFVEIKQAFQMVVRRASKACRHPRRSERHTSLPAP